MPENLRCGKVTDKNKQGEKTKTGEISGTNAEIVDPPSEGNGGDSGLASMAEAQEQSLKVLFESLSVAHGNEAAVSEWASRMPEAVKNKILQMNVLPPNEINPPLNEDQSIVNDGSTKSSTPSVLGNSRAVSPNPETSTVTGIISQESLVECLSKALRLQNTWTADNVSRIPEIHGSGVNEKGESVQPLKIIFKRIEEIFSDENLRRDALIIRAKGVAKDVIYKFTWSNPDASYEAMKAALLKRFEPKLNKVEYISQFR